MLLFRCLGVGSLAGSYSVITTRTVSTGLFLLILAPILDRNHSFLKIKKSTLALLFIGGLVANALGWLRINFSFMNIVESQAVPISSKTPLFSALAGFMLFKERLTLNRAIGAAIIVVGVVLIFLD